MKIGIPKEIKISENRVGMTEAGVIELVKDGHSVFVEKNAGLGSYITNEDYIKCGAQILETKKEVYDIADMIVKVKEPCQMSLILCEKGKLFTPISTWLQRQSSPKLL